MRSSILVAQSNTKCPPMSTTSNGNKKQLSLHTSNENRLNALKAVDSGGWYPTEHDYIVFTRCTIIRRILS